MLSFSGFRLEDGSPIYQQIIRYLEQGIAAGTIRDGDGLPSRRVLSAQLGVNPNTVQKACRMLEEAGLITSRSGAKSEFTLDEAAVAAVRTRLMEREAAALRLQANFEYWADTLANGTPQAQAQIYRERGRIQKWIDRVLNP